MRMYDVSFPERARELCVQYGVLLVFDEVATGFGRTGNRFAADLVLPDILVLGLWEHRITWNFRPENSRHRILFVIWCLLLLHFLSVIFRFAFYLTIFRRIAQAAAAIETPAAITAGSTDLLSPVFTALPWILPACA